MATLDEIGIAAVDKFIDTWNSRDAEAWAGSLNFPHVRPAPFGPIEVARDAEQYVSRVDFNRVIETGWDHSEWDYKHVLHVSPRKIHVVGQWSRYNANGEIILTNPVVYVVTNAGDGWGIQSRFSADHAGDDDTSSMETRAFKLIETYVNFSNARNEVACAELLNYPHFDVQVGTLSTTGSPDEFKLASGTVTIDALMALQTGHRSMNASMDITLSTSEGTRQLQSVLNLTERDEHLGIQAWSFLDPNEIEDD